MFDTELPRRSLLVPPIEGDAAVLREQLFQLPLPLLNCTAVSPPANGRKKADLAPPDAELERLDALLEL